MLNLQSISSLFTFKVDEVDIVITSWFRRKCPFKKYGLALLPIPNLTEFEKCSMPIN